MIEFNTYQRFIDYVKYLCVQHNALQHADIDGQKVFFLVNVERETAFTSDEIKPQDYCVVLLFPELEKSNQAGILINNFMLFVGKYSNTVENAEEMANAMHDSSVLLTQFLARLQKDETNNRFFLGRGDVLNIATAEPIENYYPNYSGYLMPISVATRYKVEDNTIWLDNGVSNF